MISGMSVTKGHLRIDGHRNLDPSEIEIGTIKNGSDITAQRIKRLIDEDRRRRFKPGWLAQIVNSDSHEQLVARLSKRIIGTATLSLIGPLFDRAALSTLAVDEKFAHLGVAERIVESVGSVAFKMGATIVVYDWESFDEASCDQIALMQPNFEGPIDTSRL
jgi:hypothetical protein